MDSNSKDKYIKGSIIAIGVLIVIFSFLYWACTNSENSFIFYFAGFLSCLLSCGIFMYFVPLWLDFWRKNDKQVTHTSPEKTAGRIIFAMVAASVAMIVAVMVLAYLMLEYFNLDSSLSFWLCTDSAHYMDIAREWYLSEGTIHRIVQLVFFPGYPLLVRFFNCFIGNYLYSGFLVSWISVIFSVLMMYKLFRLDADEKTSLRAVKYLLICPAVFFFVAPMSDSLFLLLCISCLYCIRTKRITAGCILAGMASFTRSLGITLIVPIFFEVVNDLINRQKIPPKTWAKIVFSLPLVFTGFFAYLYINYDVAGNPFQFMEYQSNHWGQNLGFYFANAAKFCQLIKKCIVQGYPDFLVGKVLPNLMSCFVPLVLVLVTVKKLRVSYIAWFIAYYMLSLGPTELLSGPRYMMAFFPLFLSLAIITENKKSNIAVTILSICALIVYMIAFIQRWGVW